MQISGEVSRVVCAHMCLNEGWDAPSTSVARLHVRSLFFFFFFFYFSLALCLVGEGNPLSWLHNASMRTWSSNGKMVRPGISAADHGEFDAMREEGLLGSIGPFLKQVRVPKRKSEIISKAE